MHRMHEMSIAIQIVEIAEREARKDKAAKIKSVELEIGTLSGVVIEALQFALESAVKNTLLQNSTLLIDTVPGLCRCSVCKHEFESNEVYTICNQCGSMEVAIIKGNEMRVKSLLVE